MMRGEDVEAVQRRLLELGYDEVGRADGIFGLDTQGGVRLFQSDAGMEISGTVDRATWDALFSAEDLPSDTTSPAAPPDGEPAEPTAWIDPLKVDHGIFDSVQWRLANDGIRIDGAAPENTGGRPLTVSRVWSAFAEPITTWGNHYDVPVELIIATACTETRGDPERVRREPGYISDEETPHRISPGLMQTLISTARDALSGEIDDIVDRAWLLVPSNSIRAGTAYISQQRAATNYDPPKVACAYNAGSVIRNDSPGNRWKMRQFPIGTSEHADRFVKWFNDGFRFFDGPVTPPANSFWQILRA